MFSKKSRRTSSSLKMVILVNDEKNVNKSAIGDMKYTNMNRNKVEFMQRPVSTHNTTVNLMTWGNPTWTFLHTLVEKVKDEHFSKLRNELLKNIYIICTNLPCPECSMHSKKYLNSVNFNTITTKTQLKHMLCEFHNSVNSRKGFNLFNIADLETTYNNQILSVTFYNFLIKFKDRGASNRFIHEDIYRAQLSKDVVKWFNINKEFFYE